jgi:hypothetical protein
MLGDEHSNDEQVISEFALVVTVPLSAWILVAENHEPHISLSEHPLEELHGESREPVFVGNHNFRDISTLDAFQKGTETAPMPIDARGNVPEELVRRVRGAQRRNLPLEVAALVLAANPRVDRTRFLGTAVGLSISASAGLLRSLKGRFDILGSVEVLATGHANAA